MASDIKISQMPSATSLEGTEIIPIVQGGTNKSTTVNKIKEGLATAEQLGGKVDKDGSKVLSEKNFTAAYETKLNGIAENANKYVLPAASTSLGGVKQGAAVEDATSAEDIVAQFNALLASLRASGAIASGAATASFSVMSANVTSETPSENIIDFVPPMPIENGKLYKENGIVYRCIQTSKLSISNKLSDLVGYYVELV